MMCDSRPLLLVAIMFAATTLTRGAQNTPQPGFADPLLGRWDLTVQGPDGPYPSWLEVHLRKETQLQARFVGRFGSVRYPTQVTYADGQLTVVVPVQYEKNKSDLRFQGKLVDDKLEGTTEGEDGKNLSWTAVRAPAVTPATAVKWGTPTQLFTGKDVSGWKLRGTARADCWKAIDGTLTNVPPCADLMTDRTFTDFKLHVEFMYPAGSNSGVYLRGRYEVQIEDNAGMAVDYLRIGGVYGFLRPYVNAALPAGQWQTYDITLVGRRVTLLLNGKAIIQDEVIPGITGGALTSDEGSPGPIMVQGDHGKISFRNIRLTPAM
jgi:hypothetical protein